MSTTALLAAQRQYFNTGATQSYDFRIAQLKALKAAILKYEEELYTALHTDLKKSREESWVTELGFVLSEIKVAMRNLRRWMKPERKDTNLINFPSSSRVYSEPLGVVLIISPWNYPFQLLIDPLIGAIAAGNCVVLKPSEFAPATAAVTGRMIAETFAPEYISYAPGDGKEVIPAMMEQFRFDHVFYTGSTVVGKDIYKLAAEKLVPVTLELGGKSPCVVLEDADIKVTAKRIAIAKFTNSGQTCVAPDYILVKAAIKDKLVAALKETITSFFSAQPETDYGYCRIINKKQFERLIGYLEQGTIVYGGTTDAAQLFIAPTILENITLADSVMQEEIFGPILPVLTFNEDAEALRVISANPNPLAFYLFTSGTATAERWIAQVPFGGGCINNASWHLTNHHLPFGGRGASGTGRYHGRYTFDTFSHQKAVMKTPIWFDLSMKYPPFKGKLNIFKKITG